MSSAHLVLPYQSLMMMRKSYWKEDENSNVGGLRTPR
jgi:hypothetical protein